MVGHFGVSLEYAVGKKIYWICTKDQSNQPHSESGRYASSCVLQQFRVSDSIIYF